MSNIIGKLNYYSSFRGGSRFVIQDFASFNAWRERIAGLDRRTPLLDGRMVPYINLDNAASTPPLRAVLEAIERFLPYYSSVHRGTGFKSRVSTAAYDDAHEIIGRFVGADPESNTVIFGKNSTEAINKLAYRYPLPPGQRDSLDGDGAPLERSALAPIAPRWFEQRSLPRAASTRMIWTGCLRSTVIELRWSA